MLNEILSPPPADVETAGTLSAADLGRSAAVILLQTAAVVLTTALILAGNAVNIAVLRSSQLWHRSTTVFLTNLSVTDGCIGLSITWFAVYPSAADRPDWPYGQWACAVSAFVGGTCCGASILTLGLIGVDRYFIVVRPLDHRNLLTANRVYLLVVASWTVPAVLHLVPLLKHGQLGFSTYNPEAFLCHTRYTEFRFLTVFLVAAVYLLTNVVIFVAYWRIIPVSLRHSEIIRRSRVPAAATAGRRESCFPSSNKSNKAVFTLLVISVVYNLCWAPMALTLLLEALGAMEDFSPGWEFVIAWLAMSNSYLNSFVYFAMNARYRRAVRKLFACGLGKEYLPQQTLSMQMPLASV